MGLHARRDYTQGMIDDGGMIMICAIDAGGITCAVGDGGMTCDLFVCKISRV